MENCPSCNRAISNYHCPHCEEVERGKTRHHESDFVYKPLQSNKDIFQTHSYGPSKSTGPGLVFNVIAAIVIIGITLYVAYQVMISK